MELVKVFRTACSTSLVVMILAKVFIAAYSTGSSKVATVLGSIEHPPTQWNLGAADEAV
jgi:hypothetical protein